MIRLRSTLLLSLALALSACDGAPPADVAAAERAIAEHRFQDAQRTLMALREAEGRTPATAALLAKVMVALGDGYAAERYLDEMRAADGQTPQWTVLAAEAMILQGRPHKARELLAAAGEEAALADPKLAWLGVWTAMEEGEVDEAAARVTEALARHPQSPDLHTKAARIALWQDDPDTADAHIAAAIAADPRHYEALLLTGERRIAAGDLEGALPAYQAASKAYPDFAVPRANVVGLLLDLGRLDEAQTELDEALARQPDFALLRFNAARLHALNGRWPEARRTLQAIPSAFAREFPAATLLQGEIEAALGNHGMARTLYQSLADHPVFGAPAAELMAQLPEA